MAVEGEECGQVRRGNGEVCFGMGRGNGGEETVGIGGWMDGMGGWDGRMGCKG